MKASGRGGRVNPTRRGPLASVSRRARRQTTHNDLAQAFELTRRTYKRALWADVTANIIRNVWAYSIIFCGHFPDQTYTFSPEETEDETRGAPPRPPTARRREHRRVTAVSRDVRQPRLSGRAHLYPDMPSTRYGEIAPRVREICERYKLPYNTGPFLKQLEDGPAHDPAARPPRR